MANKRNYVIYEELQKDASLTPLFEACAASILEGNARPGNEYPFCFRVNGRKILTTAMLEYYLALLDGQGFTYEKAQVFSDRMIQLCGWSGVSYTLTTWVNRVVRDPFFQDENHSDNGWNEHWVLKPGEPGWRLPEEYLRFACYVGVCCVKHGASHETITAQEIFGFLEALGSDLPSKLKKYGSGALPKELLEYRDAVLSCKANDVFATIAIALKEESEAAYGKALAWLCRLLESGFPKSYAVNFRSPEKHWLPVKGLPKKGVHHLFAGAAQWPGLHELMERYARLSMQEYHWYTNLEDKDCAMPGTFAVFALGLLGDRHHALVRDYLKLCDGEHQSMHGKFVLAYIEKFGFTEKGSELYELCANNIQEVPKKLEALYTRNMQAKPAKQQ